MSRSRDPCGCCHDGHKWIALCPPHAAECAELKERGRLRTGDTVTPQPVEPVADWLQIPDRETGT